MLIDRGTYQRQMKLRLLFLLVASKRSAEGGDGKTRACQSSRPPRYRLRLLLHLGERMARAGAAMRMGQQQLL